MADSADSIVVRPRDRRRRSLQVAAPTLLGAALAVTACGGASASQPASTSQPTEAPADDVMSEDPGPVEDVVSDDPMDAPTDDALEDDAPNDDPPTDDGAPEDDAPNDDGPSDDEG